MKKSHVPTIIANTVEVILTDSSTYSSLHKTPFFSTRIHTIRRNVDFYIPVSGQLKLRTPFSRPEGLRLRELL